MDKAVRTYDPKKIIVTWGTMTISGWADGTFLKIAGSSGDAFEKRHGADGGIDRVNKNVYDYAVTVTLRQTSPLNTKLSLLHTADQLSNLGTMPLTVKDMLGDTLFEAPEAWIAKPPEGEWGDSLGNREWRFDTGPAAYIDGGNN